MRKIIMILFAMLLFSSVSAWTNNTFNNSISNENLSIAVNTNVTRYLVVPSSVSYLTAGMFNLSFTSPSIKNFTTLSNVNSSTTSGSVANNSYGVRFFVYTNLTVVNITRFNGGTMKNCYLKDDAQIIIGNGSFVGDNCPIGEVNITQGKHYRIYFNSTLGDAYVMRYNNTMTGRYNISSIYNFINWTSGIDSTNAFDPSSLFGISNITVYQFFNKTNQTVNLSIGDVNINGFSVLNSSGFNTVINVGNLTTYINNYLATCSQSFGACFVPFTFKAFSDIVIGYSDLLFKNQPIENSQTYNPSAYSATQENFSINITYDSNYYTSLLATLNYNGTTYLGTSSGTGNNRVYSTTANVPSINTQTNMSFYWQLAAYNGLITEYYNSTFNNQTILIPTSINITSTVCPANLAPAFFFNFADEQNLSTIQNESVTYNLKYGYSANLTLFSTYGNFTNIDNFTICINASMPTYSVGYGQIQYSKTGYIARRFYIFQNTRLTNQTINNTLYSLLSTVGTSFEFTIQDNFYNPEKNKYTTLLRWFPNLNSYKVVEMGRTDDIGHTVNFVDTGTVDYRVGVYEQDGTLIYLATPLRFVCTVLPCVATITVPASSLNLFNINSLQQSLTYNYTSKVFTYIWNDPTQATSLMNLTIYRDDYAGSVPICSSSGASFTGLISCDISTYSTGTMRAVVYRTASPPISINQLIVNIAQQISDVAGGKTIGLFMSLLFFIFAILVGMFSPVVAIILGIVALVPALYFGAMSITFFVGLLLIGFIVIHFMRRI